MGGGSSQDPSSGETALTRPVLVALSSSLPAQPPWVLPGPQPHISSELVLSPGRTHMFSRLCVSGIPALCVTVPWALL